MGKAWWLLALAIAFPSVAFAQRFDDVGVRAQGMAGAFVAVADDASAAWWNPAGLATSLKFADLSTEVAEGGGRGVALAFPSLGVSYYRLKISQIPPSGTTALQPSGRQDNGASFGMMRVGVTVRDLREPTFGSGSGTGNATFVLSRRARAGAAVVMPARGALDRLVFAVDADLMAALVNGRDEREVAGGVEAWWFGSRFGVRGGAGADTVTGGGYFGAFGASVVPYPHMNLDGAVTRGSDSTRDRWSLGLRLTF